jgi:hypothetical protein
MARDAQRDEFHAPNPLGLQALADRRGKSTREPMADARQARAEGLRKMISALKRQVRLIVAIHILRTKQPPPGIAPTSGPGAQRVTSP